MVEDDGWARWRRRSFSIKLGDIWIQLPSVPYNYFCSSKEEMGVLCAIFPTPKVDRPDPDETLAISYLSPNPSCGAAPISIV